MTETIIGYGALVLFASGFLVLGARDVSGESKRATARTMAILLLVAAVCFK
jgi:hypothetical protein